MIAAGASGAFPGSPAAAARPWSGRTSDADHALVAAAREGDSAAFERLFRKHQASVYRVCLGVLGNAEDAADLTQEVFLHVHTRLDRFHGTAAFSTWLYRTAVNLCLTERRRTFRKRETAEDTLGLRAEVPDPHAALPEQALLGAAAGSAVWAVLGRLTPDHRAVLVLRHFEDLEYQEIAEVLGVPLSVVKTRLFRAREQFSRRFHATCD